MKRYWIVLLLALAECSPNVSFYVIFQLPGQAKIDAARLHLRGVKRCSGESGPELKPPEPGLELPDNEENWRHTITQWERENDSMVKSRFRASRCEIALTAWYDTNGDNLVDRGDHVATVAPTEITSGGMCLPNKNYLGIVTMRPVD